MMLVRRIACRPGGVSAKVKLVKDIILYGATGYTGGLIAAEARRTGTPVLLAGRNARELARISKAVGFAAVATRLDDGAGLEGLLRPGRVVLNAAGPFSRTANLARQAIMAGCDYVDICGEVDALAEVLSLDTLARKQSVTVLAGAGFDVVPSDCLAMYIKDRLPALVRLEFGFRLPAAMSRGTLRMMSEAASNGVVIRREGKPVKLPVADMRTARMFYFDDGPAPCLPVRWGDVATAAFSTGATDVGAWLGGAPYRVLAPIGARLAQRGMPAPLTWATERAIRLLPKGPSARQRRTGVCRIAVRGVAASGAAVAAAMTTPDAYDLTAQTALDAALRVARGGTVPGAQTPAMAFGADYALTFAGVKRVDVSAAALS